MIKVFKPMRSIAPTVEHPIRYPKLMSRKLDGIRCCKYNGKALTKSGKPINNLHIRAWIEANVPDGFDGELISGSPDIETCYGTTFSAVQTIKGTPDFSFYVFDLCNNVIDRAIVRKFKLREMCKTLDKRVIYVEQHTVENNVQMEALYAQYLSEGYEGGILVDPAGMYLYGKSSPKQQTQLKLKPQEDYEGEILDTYEAEYNGNEAFTNEVGETKRSTHAENKIGKGMVGGYRIRDVLTGEVFKVGAGKQTHPERVAEWEAVLADPNHRKGQFLKYRAMNYGTMTNGAARHGRWIGWRDKTDMEPVTCCKVTGKPSGDCGTCEDNRVKESV